MLKSFFPSKLQLAAGFAGAAGLVRVLPVLAVLVAVLVAAPRPAAALELIMFKAEHCGWCEKWEKDIGGAYPLTEEGKKAPLRRVDKSEAGAFENLERGITFTPTFVLLDEGREVGRITGYPGPDFFFPMLNSLFDKLQK